MRYWFLLVSLAVVAVPAGAIPLDLDNPNGIAAMVSTEVGTEQMLFVVCTNGDSYSLVLQGSQVWRAMDTFPVPLVEVANWTPWAFYTTDGRWFGRSNPSSPWEEFGGPGNGWDLPPCFEPVAGKKESLGGVKGLFR